MNKYGTLSHLYLCHPYLVSAMTASVRHFHTRVLFLSGVVRRAVEAVCAYLALRQSDGVDDSLEF